MYYPIGWHKVLKLDTEHEILSIQSNHEQELFFILTTRSIHIWYSRPAIEIVSHKRPQESIDSIGLNKTAIWRTNSSVIVVATNLDQLLFFQLRRRPSPSSASSFLLPGASHNDSIYNLTRDVKNIKNVLISNINLDSLNQAPSVPALTIYSFGKLDLSTIGISSLLSAEEEIVIGARNGNFYGVHWNGDVDNEFPWSLSKVVKKGSDYIVDLKFSSVLKGFAFVFFSGRIGFMPLNLEHIKDRKLSIGISIKSNENISNTKAGDSRINYLDNVHDALVVEMNHKYRLVAIGLRSSKVIVCNLDDSTSTLVKNHELELEPDKIPHATRKLGAVKLMCYSPDNFALALSWESGDLALWSVFGSLLFCTQQWQLGENLTVGEVSRPLVVSSFAWGREGYALWLVTSCQDSTEPDSMTISSISSSGIDHQESLESQINSRLDESKVFQKEEILVMSLARSSLSSSPHLTCSSDAIILLSEDKLFIGPSVPHKDKFDHWFTVDIPHRYLNTSWPIRYATVDRECGNVAIAGSTGFAVYSLESSTWKYFTKKTHEVSFSVCGDIIWWKEYLLLSCLNFNTDSFEVRAYPLLQPLSTDVCIIQTISMEIVRMSIFENRLLVLYIDGTLGMFMLNLKRPPNLKDSKSRRPRLNLSSKSKQDSDNQPSSLNGLTKINRSNSTISFNYPLSSKKPNKEEVSLNIAPIENLVISNLQANSYCVASIALSRLHFKNDRHDDSILMNACGKLFLLEREAPPNLLSNSPILDSPHDELDSLSLDNHTQKELNSRLPSAKMLSNSIYFASSSLKNNANESNASPNVTFKAVSVIATNVEQFWISPEISSASDMSYFKKSLWLSCGGRDNYFQVWLPLLNDQNDPPTDLYVPDRIMLPIRCDIYPLAIRSSAPNVIDPDDAIVLGAESDILYKDSKLFIRFPYCTVKRQCRVFLHRILRELLLDRHLGYYARKIAENSQSLPYFAHCFELLLHEVLEEEATSSVPTPDPMLPQVVRFIKEFPVYLETVVHCARKSELSMWSHLFDERAVGNPRRLFQECLEKNKLDTAASCLIILQSLDRNIVSQRMIKELISAAKDDANFNYLIDDLESFLNRAEVDYNNLSGSGSPSLL